MEETEETRDGSLTRHPYVGQHGLLAVFDAADLREVNVQSQEGHAAQERHGAHEDAIVAGVLVAVEDAEDLDLAGFIDVALVGDAAKNHNGEKLKRQIKKTLLIINKE